MESPKTFSAIAMMVSIKQSPRDLAASADLSEKLSANAEERLSELSLPASSKQDLLSGSTPRLGLSADALRVRNYITAHPEQRILLFASLPNQSSESLKLEQELPKMLSTLKKEGQDVHVLRLQYPDLEAATKEFGASKRFPLSVLFSAADRRDTSKDCPLPRGPIYKDLGGFRQVIRGVPVDYINALRGL